MRFEPAVFVKSAGNRKDFIRDDRPCVVFAGKSNVGKSSVINCLLNRKNLARVGAAPGKTVNVNYYLVGGTVWFVDLPGYGYAKRSQAERARWAALMEDFFTEPERISVGLQVLDGRHKPTEQDCVMSDLFRNCGCPWAAVANKWDKLKKSEMESSLALIRETLQLGPETALVPFSAERRTGRTELLGILSGIVG